MKLIQCTIAHRSRQQNGRGQMETSPNVERQSYDDTTRDATKLKAGDGRMMSSRLISSQSPPVTSHAVVRCRMGLRRTVVVSE